MAWYDEDSLLTKAVGPNPWAVVITILAVIGLPILLHLFFYRTAAPKSLPKFLVVGPTDSGKTTLVTNFERGAAVETHTSIESRVIETTLPRSVVPSSARYRSENDFENQTPKKLLLVDSPGHAKLRQHALNVLNDSDLTGVIFVVDAANLDRGDGVLDSGLREAAVYLHDVLLALQSRYVKAKSSKTKEIPVLVAANKMDLFSSLPVDHVRSSLEGEITRLRDTRAKGIASIGKAAKGEGLESAAGREDDADEDESNVLGGVTSGKFEFASLRDLGIEVSVEGGIVGGAETPDTEKWWDWIASLL